MTYGTERQNEYLTRLAQQLGYSSVAAALADHTSFGAVATLSRDDASHAIEQLKKAAGVGNGDKPGRYLTARHLRQIATGEKSAPDGLDEDARWVLDRLRYAVALGALASADAAGSQVPAEGVNQRGPIEIAQLLEFFGDWDALAEAFEVTVSTAKAWGKHLPASRAFEAEVRTRGHVRAPL